MVKSKKDTAENRYEEPLEDEGSFVGDYDDEDEDEGDDLYSEIDFATKVRPVAILNQGLQVMNNEMARLAGKSQEKGLKASERGSVSTMVLTALKVAKDKKFVNLDELGPGDENSMSHEELAAAVIEAGRALSIDLEAMSIYKEKKNED